MIIKEFGIKGVFEIQIEPILDERGYFVRTFDTNIFSEYGLQTDWVQENHSYSINKNTIRGLHFQFPPFAETKLIRVIKGEIYDVFVDLRKDSSTFGKWDSIILSENNNKMIYIPKGFAHGYCTLTENCEVLYKVDNYYNPHSESGIVWNDETLDIKFPIKTNNITISSKDSRLSKLKTFIELFKSIEIKLSEEILFCDNKKVLLYKDKNLD